MTTSRPNPWRLMPFVCSVVLTAVLAAPLIAQAEEERSESVSASQDAERSGEEHEAASEPETDDTADARPTKDRSVAPKDASQKNVSPLVRAANSSTKKKTSVRSFTDADLSSSKGKLIVIEGTNVREPEIIPIEERSPGVVRKDQGPTSTGQTDAAQRQIAAKALKEQISTLETELRQLETEYYMIEEEDHREVVERTFDEKRKALADAKEKLSKVQSGGSE